jgi:purine-binding chemotaxis protein CheW
VYSMASDQQRDFKELDQFVQQSLEDSDGFPHELYSLALGNRSKGKDQHSGRKYLLIRLSGNCFAVPLSVVREVVGLPQISELPNMPPFFAGLINLRGKIVSAIQLSKSLENLVKKKAYSKKTKRSCVVITDYQSRLFGAIIDDVVSVVNIAPEAIDHSMDEVANAEYFAGIIKFENGVLAPILNLEKALRIQELLRIEEGRKVA